MLSDTIAYVTILALTIILTAFALTLKEDNYWRVMLKLAAALFWWVMAIVSFTFFNSDIMLVLSLPYAIFGFLFIAALIKDVLDEKHERIFGFKDD